MARDYYIYGPTIVRAWGGEHLLSGNLLYDVTDLGLSSDPIRIVPNFRHTDVSVDDYGGEIPADVMTKMADATVSMNLVHFDRSAVDVCMKESTGGTPSSVAGTLAPAGTMLGRFLPLHASGNHLISLYVQATNPSRTWRFPSCYLTGPTAEWPLGTRASAVSLRWRAIPYQIPLLSGEMFPLTQAVGIPNYSGEIVSSGAVLWDYNPLA